MRQAIIALLTGQFEPAVAALSRTDFNPLERNKFRSTDVARLLQFAAKKLPLIPAELGSTDRGAGLALGLRGSLRSWTGATRPSRSSPRCNPAGSRPRPRRLPSPPSAWLALVASNPGPAATAKPEGPVKQPAAVGAHATENSVLGTRYSAAADAYLLSLRDDPRAPFHDETLRELALLIERQGAGSGEQGASGIPKNAGKMPSALRLPPSALQDALPNWLKLIAQYPTSPYLPEALYHAAKLQLAADQWKPASENLEKLVKDFPASPWAGDAYVVLIDIKLERLLDLEGAQKYADLAVRWYEGGRADGANPPAALGGGRQLAPLARTRERGRG